jgi:HlyD family secretion protein
MPTTRNPRWWKWLLLLLLLAAGVAAWRWRATHPKEPALSYKTAVIGPGDITQAVTANGQINPVKSVTVGSQISGIIMAIHVDYNSTVTNGQIIAQIDPSTYQQNVSAAEADLANAQAGLELAELNHRRSSALLKNELLPQSDYDKTVVDLHQAEAVVKTRQAALERAKVDFARTTIYAPVNGTVISRNVDVGQTVAASFNTPTLFLIANDLSKMQIEAMVSEADVGGVEVGQKTEFTVDAFPNRRFEGQVRQIRYAPVTNQNVVNYVTVVDVENRDFKLRPGMTANASIITAQRADALRIPNAALRFRPPEGALPRSPTNSPAATAKDGATNLAATAGTNPPAGPGPGPGRDGQRRRLENLGPEEREAARAQHRARSGDAAGRAASDAPLVRTVYLLDSPTNAPLATPPRLKAVTVKTGMTDGNFTEIVDGLNTGDVVVTSLNTPALPAAVAGGPRPGGPFGMPMGGMRPPR